MPAIESGQSRKSSKTSQALTDLKNIQVSEFKSLCLVAFWKKDSYFIFPLMAINPVYQPLQQPG